MRRPGRDVRPNDLRAFYPHEEEPEVGAWRIGAARGDVAVTSGSLALGPLSGIDLGNATLIDMELCRDVVLILASGEPPTDLSNQFWRELCPLRTARATWWTFRHVRTFRVRQLDDES
jgi:hypothetical protein